MRSGEDYTAAESCFCHAIGIAQQQRAKFWELRARSASPGSGANRASATQPANLLGPIYGWFTEGFDTPVLKEAKTLLSGLGLRYLVEK